MSSLVLLWLLLVGLHAYMREKNRAKGESQFVCFENMIFAGVPKVVEQRPATGVIQAHKCLLTMLRGIICVSVNVCAAQVQCGVCVRFTRITENVILHIIPCQ
jgi:hypothetical protein